MPVGLPVYENRPPCRVEPDQGGITQQLLVLLKNRQALPFGLLKELSDVATIFEKRLLSHRVEWPASSQAFDFELDPIRDLADIIDQPPQSAQISNLSSLLCSHHCAQQFLCGSLRGKGPLFHLLQRRLE